MGRFQDLGEVQRRLCQDEYRWFNSRFCVEGSCSMIVHGRLLYRGAPRPIWLQGIRPTHGF